MNGVWGFRERNETGETILEFAEKYVLAIVNTCSLKRGGVYL